MLAGPRFALSEFSVFTYTQLENSDLENSDFSETKNQKTYKLEEETYVENFNDNYSMKLCST